MHDVAEILGGSSPRMRGTRGGRPSVRGTRGIIPAYAGNTPSTIMRPFRKRDHPRVCGEHIPRVVRYPSRGGSSPRMRGTPYHLGAYAMPSVDHPRVCGEHARAYSIRAKRLGSSPRMRGTLHGVPVCGPKSRIIPAYAGNTSQCAALRALLRDHPRVCGEHDRIVGIIAVVLGSSPRMRGTHVKKHARPRMIGIIPAYAGNTADHAAYDVTRQDHPRVCGEHYNNSMDIIDTAGSSPRMRGTLNPATPEIDQTGIIPAYAGNTVCATLEHMFRSGSSPRMRGTHMSICDTGQWHGIIPAYAGNTSNIRLKGRPRRDHPRVCGEHDELSAVVSDVLGSSPRMRGTRANLARLTA